LKELISMKLVLALLLVVGIIGCLGDDVKDVKRKFKKMKKDLDKANTKMTNIEEKIKHNKANGVKYHPTSCEEVGEHRTVLPQHEEQPVTHHKVGTLPGKYIIYKADYDNVGRPAYCYSRPKNRVFNNPRGRKTDTVSEHVMYEATNCQDVRFAVRSQGEDVNRNFWVKIGDHSEQVRCEGDEVVIMQRGYGSDEIPNRKIDFKQHFEWYMKGFGKMKTNSDFFMGLDPLAAMTSVGTWELTVTVERKENYYARDLMTDRAYYSNFKISQYPEYTLDYDEYLEKSSMKDSLQYSKGNPFSSWDRERTEGLCTSETHYGGPDRAKWPSSWWYGKNENLPMGKLYYCGFDESPFMYGFGWGEDTTNQQVWGYVPFIEKIKMTMKRTDVAEMNRRF